MKKEARIAILVKVDHLYAICIFRGNFLEKLFLDINEDNLIKQIVASSIIHEIRYSNIGIGENFKEQAPKKICENLIKKLSEKLNIDKVNG
ncbi:DNA-directed RNA polymerase subunit M [Sulfolobus sp. E5-1-F]|uniref:DNA-directed RNA polymerase subunit M n=1 Tax=Sulfolobaceae TaxID=118883 RepID=UPI001295309B|nr:MULTISPECIES: DNA-directed RNA polymerase subunit M [unclassified Sulfolobus]QGA54911.1 DNA-directed RNA polymerase subunit M [Sulfolobus sp. E5-1-F]QGA67744.1 DNA-directed RNA polymerase subunit M [Sulfolobus sp. E11-6]